MLVRTNKLQKEVRENRASEATQRDNKKKRLEQLAENWKRNKPISDAFWGRYAKCLPAKYRSADSVRKHSNTIEEAFVSYRRCLRNHLIDDTWWVSRHAGYVVYKKFTDNIIAIYGIEEPISLEMVFLAPVYQLANRYTHFIAEKFGNESFAAAMWKMQMEEVNVIDEESYSEWEMPV